MTTFIHTLTALALAVSAAVFPATSTVNDAPTVQVASETFSGCAGAVRSC